MALLWLLVFYYSPCDGRQQRTQTMVGSKPHYVPICLAVQTSAPIGGSRAPSLLVSA
ncbi:hypothetical protein P7K49_000668 [Saguinus oedipus]|uniref:Uncharacterized protein n=1 Tax=Saguinus oedipus TaxID=9490 RepID=A0ABQ9WCB6_SAGOE|nr:hypothetical protein P7K49_000668 [Saguinus oedipus]